MKNALVTGVSWTTGIGFAITQQLVKDGYYVYAVYRSDESTAKEYFDAHPKKVEMIQCDLTDRKAVKKLINKLSDVSLNVIVNNAGAFSGGEDVDNFDMAEWDRIFAVNVNAPLMLSVGLKPNLEKNAVIVNMVSTDWPMLLARRLSLI